MGLGDKRLEQSIVFAQFVGSEIRVIDFYENSQAGAGSLRSGASGEGQDPRLRVRDDSILPHDAQVRELGTGKIEN